VGRLFLGRYMDLWDDSRLMRLPSTKTLRAFQLAARSGSFKTAASQLFLTPSAVSHQIRALEEELGVALFHRGARTLTLTDAGSTYLREIEHLFERLDAATRELRARAGRSTLRLRVASFFANEFLLPRLAELHAAQPEIDLEIDTDGTGTDIHPADADVSVVLGPGTWSELQAQRLFTQAYVPACSPALLVRTPINSVEQLEGQTLLVFEARKDGWERWAESAGLEMPRPRKRIAFNNMASLVRATERAAGIGLIPALLSAERFRAKSLTRLFDHDWETEDSYFLVHRAEVAARPEVIAFRKWILEEVRKTIPLPRRAPESELVEPEADLTAATG
jgi:LysR family transcriptional regulator, glycine cleavage system transcriptional activator